MSAFWNSDGKNINFYKKNTLIFKLPLLRLHFKTLDGWKGPSLIHGPCSEISRYSVQLFAQRKVTEEGNRPESNSKTRS